MRCPACNARVGDDATVCGQCGRKLRDDDAKKTMMGIPTMGSDDEGQDEESEQPSAKSTLFGIPAASREEQEDDDAPQGPGGGVVRDDATPVPDNYQGDGDARTQVADGDTLTNALRDSGAHQQPNSRSTMYGLPKADDGDDIDGDDDIAAQWGLGEESDDGESKTMVASANLLDQASDSNVAGEGTGYSKPQADVDPNVQTLHGMMGDEADDGSNGSDDEYDEYDQYDDDVGDATQALSPEELEQFEQQIMEEDGFGAADAGGDAPPATEAPPTQTGQSQSQPRPPEAEQDEPADDSTRRRSLLQKLKRRSEEDGGDDPRKTAAGIPAAQEGKKGGDRDDFGRDTIDERGGSGTRFSIPSPGGSKSSGPSAPQNDSESQTAQTSQTDRGRSETPRSGVLSAKKPGSKQSGGERGVLESSSSYRISGSSEPELEGREPVEDTQPAAQDRGGQEPSTGPSTSFPISDSQSSPPSQPQAEHDGDATAMLDDDEIAELSLDDTAAIEPEESTPFEEPQQDDADDLALAETGVADPDGLPGTFDESRSAAPEQFGDSVSGSNTSGVVQPGGTGSGVQQPQGSTSGVVQPGSTSGVIQPGESSGVVQPGEAPGLQQPSEGGSGVIQPDGASAGDSGISQPSGSGIEPPASSTQRGGFGAEPSDSGIQQPAPQPSQPEPQGASASQQQGAEFDFGATPAGASSAGGPGAPQQGAASGGFGSSQVPNPSQGARATSNQQHQTQPPADQEDEASSLERKVRVVFAALGALVTLGAGGASFAAGAMQLPAVEKGIFLSPIAIGLLTLGVGLLPLSRGIKTAGLVVMTLLTGAALAGAVLFEASAIVMLLLVGGTLLTLCSAAFPALVKLVK